MLNILAFSPPGRRSGWRSSPRESWRLSSSSGLLQRLQRRSPSPGWTVPRKRAASPAGHSMKRSSVFRNAWNRLPQIASDCLRLLQIASMLTENLQSPIIFPKWTAKKLKRGNCKVWDSTQLLQDFGLHRPQISSMWAHPPWSGHNVPVVPSQRFSYLWK